MEALANSTRFFGNFNFLSPAETGPFVCKTLSPSRIRFYPPHGTDCA